MVRSFRADGASRAVLNLLQHLSPPIRVTAVSLDGSGTLRPAFESAVSRLGGEVQVLPTGWRDVARTAMLIRRHEWLRGIDVVAASLMRPDAVGRRLVAETGHPYLLIEHGLHAWSDKSVLLRPFIRRWYSRTLPEHSAIVAVSPKVQRDLLAEGIPPDRIRLIANGVPAGPLPTPQERAKARASLQLPADATVVAIVGGLTANKRPRLAVEAVAQLRRTIPNAVLVVCGEGPLGSRLESLARQIGVPAHFTGSLPSAQPVYTAADLLIHPSTQESFGLVAMEALAAGLPVVARAGSGLEALLPPSPAAFLVGDDDPNSWATALQCALETPNTIETYRNLYVREQYSPDLTARGYEEVIRELATNGRLAIAH